MESELEYYRLSPVRGKQPTRVTEDESAGREGGVAYLNGCYQVDDDFVSHVIMAPLGGGSLLAESLVDHYPLAGSAIFSARVASVLQGIKGLQLVKALINANGSSPITGYFVANVYQSHASFSKEKTKFAFISETTGAWVGISSIVLDKKQLLAIPLEDRLVYKAKEHPSFYLYHKLVADKIASVNPTGLQLTPVAVE